MLIQPTYVCCLQSEMAVHCASAVSASLSDTRFHIFIISLEGDNGLRPSAWETSYSLKDYSVVAIWEAGVVGEP